MVLMAVCDTNYRFILFDFGQYGSNNDNGVLQKSIMGKKLENNDLNIPPATHYSGCNYDPLSYFLVGDEIFPLKTYIMRPYPGSGLTKPEAVYNYRHSRARGVIENTFGILCSRWRIFFTPINAKAENVEMTVMACIALHNYLKTTYNSRYCPASYINRETADGQVIEGNWRRESPSRSTAANVHESFHALQGRRSRDNALHMRDCLKDYVNSEEGSLERQLSYVRRMK